MSIASRVSVAVFTIGTVGFSGGVVRAQNPAPAPGTSSANTQQKTDNAEKPQNYLERTFTISGQIRERWEGGYGSNFAITPAESYVLSRIRVGLAYKPVSWLRFFGETQDSRALFYQKSPTNSVSDPFDWRQGYVEAGVLEGNGVKARMGRQDLFIGSTRLVTTGDWSNVTKAYDVANGAVTEGLFRLQLIAGTQVLPDVTRADRGKPGEHFYVAYASFRKLIPGASIEPYVMAKTQFSVKSKEGITGGADTLYPGGRIIGTTKGHLDYNFEGVKEAGSYANESVNAWGYAGGGGWTVAPSLWKLHISSDYTFASGSDGRKDGVHQQFDYLYGTQQPLNSLTGQFAWRNIEDFRAGADFKPLRKLTVKIDYRDYWLATVQDGLYSAIGTETVLNAKAASNHVAEGVDSMFVFAINGKTSLGTGIGTLTPGAYLIESKKTTGFFYPFFYFQRSL